MNIVVHPAAIVDLNNAANFYAERANKQLGLALIVEFEKAVLFLSNNPELGTKWVSGTHRFIMHRFPFNVVYRIFPDHLYIIAIAHQRRRPDYWRQRT
ncbi:MAG: type II toxin-antitoxin system RelE/ParE family toxin [Gallionellaceae bacterium]|nr:type II toxin-antitoxin system RelE/ParE family toxin [Gallionellaceae bacterium]